MQFHQLKRREFITLLGGAATWPITARAQQGERMRRIAVLLSTGEGDPQRQAQLAAFVQRLMELGWTDGRNGASTFAGAQAMPTRLANTRRNWSRSRRTLRSPIPATA